MVLIGAVKSLPWISAIWLEGPATESDEGSNPKDELSAPPQPARRFHSPRGRRGANHTLEFDIPRAAKGTPSSL